MFPANFFKMRVKPSPTNGIEILQEAKAIWCNKCKSEFHDVVMVGMGGHLIGKCNCDE